MFAIILLDSAMYKIDFPSGYGTKIFFLNLFIFEEWFNKFKSVTTKTQFKVPFNKRFS